MQLRQLGTGFVLFAVFAVFLGAVACSVRTDTGPTSGGNDAGESHPAGNGGNQGAAGQSSGGSGFAGNQGTAGNGGSGPLGGSIGSGGQGAGGLSGAGGSSGAGGVGGQGTTARERIVGVGSGTRRIWSDDGKTWTESANWPAPFTDVTDGDNEFLFIAACYSHGHFIGGGHEGGVITSPDGSVWTETRKAGGPGIDACAGNDVIATTGSLYSEDGGQTWHDGVDAPEHTNQGGLAYGNGAFVLMGSQEGSPPISAYSTDGKTWQKLDFSLDNGRVAFGAGHFIVAGNGSLRESSDGSHWTELPMPTIGDVQLVAHGAGRFVVAGSDKFLVRVDGSDTWQAGDAKGLAGQPLMGAGTTSILLLGSNGGGAFYWSTDGFTWSEPSRVESGKEHTYGLGGFAVAPAP